MKLIPFTYTSEYDAQSAVYVNPAFVVTLRPEGKSKTQISLASKAQITVDGKLEDVALLLSGDYDPGKTEEHTSVETG